MLADPGDHPLALQIDHRLGALDRAIARVHQGAASSGRSEEHTSELQSLMRISYAVFCLKKKNRQTHQKMPKPTKSAIPEAAAHLHRSSPIDKTTGTNTAHQAQHT